MAGSRTGSSTRSSPSSSTTAAARSTSWSPGPASAPSTRPTSPSAEADLFPMAICQSGVYDAGQTGWGRGDAVYFNNPMDYVANLGGDHLDWLRGAAVAAAHLRPGPVGGHHRGARVDRPPPRREGHPSRDRPVGPRRPHDWPSWRASSPTTCHGSSREGRHDHDPPDRPAARDRGRLADGVRAVPAPARPRIELDGETHEVATERVTIEPFDLRQPVRHAWSSTAWPTGTTTRGGSRRSP